MCWLFYGFLAKIKDSTEKGLEKKTELKKQSILDEGTELGKHGLEKKTELKKQSIMDKGMDFNKQSIMDGGIRQINLGKKIEEDDYVSSQSNIIFNPDDDPLTMLKKRFVKGEITKKQYNDMKKVLE